MSLCQSNLPAGSDVTIAVATIHRPTLARFKWHFGILATLGAYRREHLASASVATIPATLRLPGLAARQTALGIVGIATGSKEFLLVSTEREGSSAVRTLDLPILKAHWITSFYK